jgi:hypothetical protein
VQAPEGRCASAYLTYGSAKFLFSKADLSTIILAFILMMWQNQCYLTHLRIPELPRMLLLNLENIEQVMVEKHN